MNFCLLVYSINYKRSVKSLAVESGLKLRDKSLITDTVHPLGYSLLQAKERERFGKKKEVAKNFNFNREIKMKPMKNSFVWRPVNGVVKAEVGLY